MKIHALPIFILTILTGVLVTFFIHSMVKLFTIKQPEIAAEKSVARQSSDAVETNETSTDSLGSYANPLKVLSGKTKVISDEENKFKIELPEEFEKFYDKKYGSLSVTVHSKSFSLNEEKYVIDDGYSLNLNLVNKNKLEGWEEEFYTKIYPHIKYLGINKQYTYEVMSKEFKEELLGNDYKNVSINGDRIYTMLFNKNGKRIYFFLDKNLTSTQDGYIAIIENETTYVQILVLLYYGVNYSDADLQKTLEYHKEQIKRIVESVELKN